jgi:hypothetical protein
MEHRWGERTSVDMPVRLRTHAGGTGVGRLADVSTSGAFVRTEGPLAPLSCLDILINGHAVPTFVVRNRAEEVGLEWCDLAPDIVSAVLLESHAHPLKFHGAVPQEVAALA